MVETFTEHQRNILKLLLKRKQGLSADEISASVGISRPSARHHLVALERNGYIERAELAATGGRPVQPYRLTRQGYELFPKQYYWFSEVLLEKLKAQLGSEGVRDLMEALGNEVGEQAAAGVQGATLKDRVQQVARLMDDLAYQAETVLTGKELPGEPPVIEASNCVFHSLAARYPEICRFDLALLTRLTGAKVVQEKCILRGSETCRFRFRE